MLDCDINIGRLFHGLKALGDKCRLEHQTGAETAPLDALGRTPAIQVNFIVPGLVNPLCGLGELRGVTASDLTGNGVFGCIKT